MFSPVMLRFQRDIDTVRKMLAISEQVRGLLLELESSLSGADDPIADRGESGLIRNRLKQLLESAPDKLDWQIHDHCAALTRLYAAYERFVGELVSEYTALLPKLYDNYAELPQAVISQHRLGIGQILLKIGEKGRYRNLEEQTIIQELARGLGGAAGYSLLAEAFFTEGQNLRFQVLARLLSFLGFRNPGRFINRHPDVKCFIKAERADSSSPAKELDAFIEYRNEASHRQVDNVLSVDAILSIGRFLSVLAHAVTDLVEEGVLDRRMALGHYTQLLSARHVHYGGFVAVGCLGATTLRTGEEVIAFGDGSWRRTAIESIQIDDAQVEEAVGDGRIEVGVRLNKRVSAGSEIRRLKIPGEAAFEIQLQLEDALPPMVDIADTDVADPALESQPAQPGTSD
jgi:hypothetical protein